MTTRDEEEKVEAVEKAAEVDPFDAVRSSWGFPAFARDFPRDPRLDALVTAFAGGNYAAVREGAPKLAAEADDPAIKRAATLLRARIEPDPSARVFFFLAAALLVFLSAWWIAHDGPEGAAPAAKEPPKIEIVK
ncbi:MAG: hypothetical protein KF819_30145 [Labilithrix sp.]|nr:hypothetical protein [Labilithrix sp.]